MPTSDHYDVLDTEIRFNTPKHCQTCNDYILDLLKYELNINVSCDTSFRQDVALYLLFSFLFSHDYHVMKVKSESLKK